MAKTNKPIGAGSLSGLWAISPSGWQRVQQAIAGFDWTAPADDTRFDQRETKVAHGVAVIPMVGVVMKYAGFYDRWFDVVSTEWVEREIDRLEADSSVKRIVLLMDSPGGMVDGSTQLGSRIRRCTKRIDGVVSDNCCSAMFWLGSQCASLTANASADVGSIGVIHKFVDDSKMMTALGLEIHTVASSAIKAAGHDGKFNETLKAEMQRGVDDTYEMFVSTIASGRKLSIDDVRRLADGRVYRAAEAASLGLIDRVVDAAVAIDAIQQEVIAMTQAEFQQMAASNPDWVKPMIQQGYDKAKAELTPPIASAEDVKAAFPDDKDFVFNRIGVNASMAEHKAAYADHLKTQLEAKSAEISTLKEHVAQADPAAAGTTPANTPTEQREASSPLVQDAVNRAKAYSTN